MPGEHLMYADLAAWWPLVSAPEEYAEEAAEAARHLMSARIPVREVLELGSGGGNNARHLRERFTMTLVDLAPAMLEVSRRLNPECEHVVGDMRSVRLGRTFDGVFVHDAIDYLLTEDDIRATLVTAFEHCRPGGVAVLVPDNTTETYRPGTDGGGHDGPDGRAVRYLEWTTGPGPDGIVTTDYVFALRSPDGDVEVVHDRHRLGLFGRDIWLRHLGAAGFTAEAVTEETSEDRPPREFFIGHRPLA